MTLRSAERTTQLLLRRALSGDQTALADITARLNAVAVGGTGDVNGPPVAGSWFFSWDGTDGGSWHYTPASPSTLVFDGSVFRVRSAGADNVFLGRRGGSLEFVSPHQSGTTANRPSSPTTGEGYFDTDVGKPIWWSGAAWVDATGTTV